MDGNRRGYPAGKLAGETKLCVMCCIRIHKKLRKLIYRTPLLYRGRDLADKLVERCGRSSPVFAR